MCSSHDITEILLKFVLNTNQSINQSFFSWKTKQNIIAKSHCQLTMSIHWQWYCTVHVYGVFLFSVVCGLFEKNRICAGIYRLIISALLMETQLLKGNCLDPIRFNLTSFGICSKPEPGFPTSCVVAPLWLCSVS